MVFRIGIGLAAALVLIAGWRILLGLGAFTTLEFHSELDCRPVLGVWSSEDIEIDSGRAYLSATDRRPRPDDEAPGDIFAFDVRAGNSNVVKLESDLAGPFRPHGIGLLREESRLLLFAVNHRPDRDAVEVFEVNGDRLHHLETVIHERFYNLNDVAAVAVGRFYLTRDHGGQWPASRWIEDVLALPLSSLLLVDGDRVREAAADIAYANGVAVSRDGSRVFVAGSRDRLVHVYEPEPETGVLTPLQTVDTATAVDNITVDEEGTLWVGAHPKPLDFERYATDPQALSPSQVLRIRFSEDGAAAIDEILLTDGRFLSGSSVAARWGRFLLVGSVFDRRFLFCEGIEEGPTADGR